MKITTTLATGETPDGSRLVLTKHDGEYYLKIDNVSLMSTTASSSEQQMAELACGDFQNPSRILIGGLGFGFTLRRVLELAPKGSSVVVAELLSIIVDWNKDYLREVNGSLLDDPNVLVDQRDVYDIMASCGKNRFDAILLDVDNSPDPLVQDGNARLYSRKGLEMIKSAICPKGRVVFWSANQDKRFEQSMKKVFGNVEAIPAKAYPKAKRFTHTLFVSERV